MAEDTTTQTDAGATSGAAATTGAVKTVADAADKGTTTQQTQQSSTQDTGASKGIWPEDWVSRFSKGDKALENQVKRYQSPEAFAEAHFNLKRRMDSGEFKPVLPKDPKPEELNAWRKDHGIPEKPEGYDLSALKIPKEDQELISGFLKSAHNKNFTPDQTRAALEFYYSDQQRQVQERQAKDEEQRTAALDVLNQEWGGSFRRNVNLVDGMLSKFPESVRDALKSARLPDGTAAFNNPDILRGFAALALELNPAGIVVPASGGDIGKSALGEYQEIQKVMREKRGDYNKNNAMQERFRELSDYLMKNEIIDAQGNVIARRKAA